MRLNEEIFRQKMHSDDRVLNLKVKDGMSATKVSGLIDSRLFKEGNRLHAIRDPRFSSWSLKYEKGALPEPLRQTWVTFADLVSFTKEYFTKRNVEIDSIEDNYDSEDSYHS